MIQDHDRSGWFGASDTSIIMGSWSTKTFTNFWNVKLGLTENTFTNRAMQAGSAYEHKILEAIGVKQMDRQIKIKKYLLRVNLDGELPARIKEVKTHSSEIFKVSKQYWQQAQVEMFAANKELDIVAYRLLESDYLNFFNEIDIQRITVHPVVYDSCWVRQKYLPRLEYLAECLREKRWPDARRFK